MSGLGVEVVPGGGCNYCQYHGRGRWERIRPLRLSAYLLSCGRFGIGSTKSAESTESTESTVLACLGGQDDAGNLLLLFFREVRGDLHQQRQRLRVAGGLADLR